MVRPGVKFTLSIALSSTLVGCGFTVNPYGASLENVEEQWSKACFCWHVFIL
jgi:hypothetical protein